MKRNLPVTRDLPEQPEPEYIDPESKTDWKRAFQVLTVLTSTGFVSSREVAHNVQKLREACGDEAADFMVQVFNGTRSQWMQDFMG
jgi:hypothetical protein